ncbi:metallophosphatase family protein [Cytophagales bacterium WSM2-2]|nr:metallophosphatase family protein [Cytophagales bacterium WSM2-2]
MRFAVLSDIHSNCFALEAVINEFVQYKIDRLIILGDIFGYYPWASKTYTLLMPFLGNAIAIKGNHDQLLLEIHPPSPEPSYWMAARQNENELKNLDPPALKWLHSLSFSSSVTIDRRKISLFHGTPQNASDGRYYPDDQKDYDWFPKTNEVILLGHTHYPLLRSTQDGGLIVNPGSVGQPRDGNPMPSWCILNTANFVFEHIRTNYNHLAAMEELKSLNWEPRSISALGKTSPGKLNF